MDKPKIFIFDIENSPSLANIWQLKTDYVAESMVENHWYMLCWAGKFLGEKRIYSSSLIDFPAEYKKNSESDKLILKKLWDLLNESDIVIGHNLKHFDVRKANARFIMNGMTPPSPYRIVDTLQVARHSFMFTSNKLNDLAKYLGLGEKIDTGGFKLWRACMQGNKTAMKKMVRYCRKDVLLTEKVYLKLLPYIQNHPNLGNYVDTDEPICPKCGSTNLVKEGFMYTNVAKYQRYSCKDCGGWSKGRQNLRENKVQNTN